MRRRRGEDGAAVVDFVLVLVVLIPLVLGLVQLCLVLYVRNTLSAAASEGARLAATADRTPQDGAALTRAQVSGVLSGRFAQDVQGSTALVDGSPGDIVSVRAVVPALGLGGPGVELTLVGHAVEEPAR